MSDRLPSTYIAISAIICAIAVVVAGVTLIAVLLGAEAGIELALIAAVCAAVSSFFVAMGLINVARANSTMLGDIENLLYRQAEPQPPLRQAPPVRARVRPPQQPLPPEEPAFREVLIRPEKERVPAIPPAEFRRYGEGSRNARRIEMPEMRPFPAPIRSVPLFPEEDGGEGLPEDRRPARRPPPLPDDRNPYPDETYEAGCGDIYPVETAAKPSRMPKILQEKEGRQREFQTPIDLEQQRRDNETRKRMLRPGFRG